MGHDYRPEREYDVRPVPGEADLPLANAMADLREEVLPALGVDDVTVFFADLDEDLGRYVSGTSSRPVIGIDHDNLSSASRIQGLEYRRQLAATLAHEAAHAYRETLGLDDLDEDAAGTFARRWVLEGIVDVSVLVPGDDGPSALRQEG